jgi:predicted DNA binding CopG/RHH family protein
MKKKMKIGDITMGTFGRIQLVEDFLPPPSELVFKKSPKTIKVTLTLDDSSVNFFKSKAEEFGGSYQRMMRNLLSEYAEHHK